MTSVSPRVALHPVTPAHGSHIGEEHFTKLSLSVPPFDSVHFSLLSPPATPTPSDGKESPSGPLCSMNVI